VTVRHIDEQLENHLNPNPSQSTIGLLTKKESSQQLKK
jgi:hypothetical protein